MSILELLVLSLLILAGITILGILTREKSVSKSSWLMNHLWFSIFVVNAILFCTLAVVEPILFGTILIEVPFLISNLIILGIETIVIIKNRSIIPNFKRFAIFFAVMCGLILLFAILITPVGVF